MFAFLEMEKEDFWRSSRTHVTGKTMDNQYQGRERGRGKAIRWLHAAFAHEGDDCLIWPFNIDNHGYGTLGHVGTHFKAHRLMCEWVNGPAPTPKHQASHSCGNGHKGCVNPKHLEWKTASGNQRDRRKHGTAHTNHWGHKGKLTPEQTLAVIRLKGFAPQHKVAAEFNISLPTVRRIQNGKTKIARAVLATVETAQS